MDAILATIVDGGQAIIVIDIGHRASRNKLSKRLNPIYLHAGGSAISHIHSYQVRNTLLRINYLTCLVSTMALSGFGPYHSMLLEDAQTKCIGVIPTPWLMTHALGLVQFPPQHE